MAEDPGKTSQVRLAFRIGYIGTSFFGSQYQPDQRTVEGEIEAACLRAGIITSRQVSRLALSGRTDRGVHAKCQILALSTHNPDLAVRALNGQLPPDIWVSAWAYAPESFYPRYDVIIRTYRYYFSRPPSDINAMRDAAGLFLGTHDFRCFARIEPGKSPVKTIDRIEVISDENGCRLEVTAQSFLWHMVRCMAGSLYQVSEGEMAIRDLTQYLKGECKNKVKPAPPEGLILWDVQADLDWHEIPAPGLKVKRIARQSEELHLLGTVYSLLLPGREG
ncbi:tRNA pseudouridine synthase A [Methanospirillum hungatei JF-1]|uniref:tRNA pseudouridine synthase A n=1 Tax=Methanospirillum hungatei JF-1 (strain ATCC 27890 / DSM 864 / NBRC 100397 / JF-1) TaxID=323259 RepID=Q2FT01_METHJ|nr:tRNA pseudouridine(38-40) synthase TruA [Methanospirillum hungatei]ABD42102.1 tRNA pseudouridine synthase A [Methanospirillum hungatei JF-1]MBP7034911.1 tRNA pseudouridine(38-40) synthase TruA [Methanospirillum sp.]MBP9009414.1 tRNA pseudouridine(38-40) synthase TruA [Methanospirillum sp.]HOW04517.1 tRNA pseudouridine(38-40) synthase TruA [Methanospirillum hungatei]